MGTIRLNFQFPSKHYFYASSELITRNPSKSNKKCYLRMDLLESVGILVELFLKLFKLFLLSPEVFTRGSAVVFESLFSCEILASGSFVLEWVSVFRISILQMFECIIKRFNFLFVFHNLCMKFITLSL